MDLPPLPPLTLRWDDARIAPGSLEGLIRGMRLDWGALRLTAGIARTGRDSAGALTVDASEGVRLTRGDEEIRGGRIVLESGSGRFRVDDALVRVPPLRLRSRTLERTPTGIVFENLRLEPDGGGRGELDVDASRGRYGYDDGRLTLFDARLRLYGVRVATLRRVGFALASDRGGGGSPLMIPITWRQSRTSGIAPGVRFPVTLAPGIVARAAYEATSQRGAQWGVETETVLYRGKTPGRSFFAGSLAPTEGTPLRRLLASPEPPKPSPFYRDILTLPELILPGGDPLTVRAGMSVQQRREFIRRDAVVLLSRRPEGFVAAHLPLGVGFADVRLTLGRAAEEAPDGTSVGASRRSAMVRLAAPPVPLVGPVRLQLQGSHTDNAYGGGGAYRVDEMRVALDTPLGGRSGIALGIVTRHEQGATPFLFDRVEAGTEGQLRCQMAWHGLVAAAALRWDLRERRLFDREIGIGLTGKILEPRFTYRTQGSQIGFTVALPGFAL